MATLPSGLSHTAGLQEQGRRQTVLKVKGQVSSSQIINNDLKSPWSIICRAQWEKYIRWLISFSSRCQRTRRNTTSSKSPGDITTHRGPRERGKTTPLSLFPSSRYPANNAQAGVDSTNLILVVLFQQKRRRLGSN